MKILISTIVLNILMLSLIQAQVSAPENFFLGLEPMEEIAMDETDPSAEPDLTGIDHKIIAYLTVNDTLNITNIYISLGTTEGGTEFYDSSFVFDNTEITEPQEYVRNGYDIRITIGIFEWNPLFYSEIKLEDNNGQFSETVTYIAN